MNRTEQQMFHLIQKSNHFLLVPHQNPDGDALGSSTAFMEYLARAGKRWSAYCATSVTPRLQFLAHAGTVTSDPAVWEDPTIDCIVVFDSGDPGYAGIARELEILGKNRPPLMNIDHHVTNTKYGDFNLVHPTASSTAEVLYQFFTACGVRVNSAMATSLLTGLLTDTDNFTNAATSSTALSVGYQLLLAGGDAKTITASVFRDKSVDTLKVWGLALARIERHPELDFVYTYIMQEDLRQFGVDESTIEGISNFMNSLGGSRVTLMLKELPTGEFKGSFRTTRDHTDVAAIAKALGGGGHKKAAGFTVPGPLSGALQRIFAELAHHDLKAVQS